MTLLALPEPYDFDVSTERFRAFGIDHANLWHEGGLYRASPEGSADRAGARRRRRVSRSTTRSARRSRCCWGFRSTCVPSTRGRPPTRFSADHVPPRGLPAAAGARPVRDARDVDHGTAGPASSRPFAIRSRMIERFGVRAELAYAFPTRERLAQATEDELFAVGFSRRKAEYVVGLARSEIDLDALATPRRRRDPGTHHRRSAASVPGRPNGSSRATSPVRAPGRSATSRSRRPCAFSTVQPWKRWGRDWIRSRT